MSDKRYDIAIVGGGVAGMTAAIYASRANLSVCLLEREVCGGLANWTYVIENYPSYPSINGLELMMKIKEHVLANTVDVVEVDEVVGMELEGPLKRITTSESAYEAKAVVLCTGREPVRLSLPVEWENIHYCSVCDGAAYKDKDVLVVGGGNSAFDESLYLVGLGVRSITIIEALDACIAHQKTQQLARETGRISVMASTKLASLKPFGKSAEVALVNTKTSESTTKMVNGVFVFIGQKPNTKILSDVVELDGNGYIVASADMETNIDGVYAAGDVVSKRYRQITTAMADGTIAALSAEKYLRRQ